MEASDFFFFESPFCFYFIFFCIDRLGGSFSISDVLFSVSFLFISGGQACLPIHRRHKNTQIKQQADVDTIKEGLGIGVVDRFGKGIG